MRHDRAKAVAAALAVVSLYAAASLACRVAGFSVISDDDFSRVVIAQAFAASPRLDPSGTSWLPLPFWAYGTVMALLGASWRVAQVVAIGLSALSGLLVFASGRALGLRARWAALAALLPLTSPLTPLLGAAAVPELPTAALSAFAICAAGSARLAPLSALAITAACLSRYDAWPLALLLAGFHASQAIRLSARRLPSLLCAAGSIAGPLSWILWNQWAHGDGLRFVHRVAGYSAALGDRAASASAYPAALALGVPALCLGALVTLFAARRRGLGLAFAGVLTQLAGLSFAAMRGGAPTHHPERAVVSCVMLLSLIACVGLSRRPRRQGKLWAAVLSLFCVATGLSSLRSTFDGLGAQRHEELALGATLRELVPAQERVLVFPDGYGFFATEAALARPGALIAQVPRTVDPRSPLERVPTGSLMELTEAAFRVNARFAVLTPSQWSEIGAPALPVCPVPGGLLVSLDASAAPLRP